jgi:hypothetical protein
VRIVGCLSRAGKALTPSRKNRACGDRRSPADERMVRLWSKTQLDVGRGPSARAFQYTTIAWSRRDSWTSLKSPVCRRRSLGLDLASAGSPAVKKPEP